MRETVEPCEGKGKLLEHDEVEIQVAVVDLAVPSPASCDIVSAAVDMEGEEGFAGQETVPAPASRCGLRRWRWKPVLRLVLAALAVVGALVVLGVFQKHLIRQALKSRLAVKEAGPWGILLVQGIFVVWVVVFLPTTVFEVLVAFTYGFWISLAISMVGKTLGSIATFCVARRFLAARARRLVAGNALMAALLDAAGQHVFSTICLVRMAYIPLAIKNVGLAVFPVSLSMYSISTFLLNLPYALCWSWLGSTADKLVDPKTNELHFGRHWQATVLMGVGFMFTILLFIAGACVTRRLARKAAQRPAVPPPGDADPLHTPDPEEPSLPSGSSSPSLSVVDFDPSQQCDRP
eukprot:EG_transcript_10678